MEAKLNTLLSPGLHLMDCMEGMAGFPDKYFDLAIVDPPYGGAVSSREETNDILRGGGALINGAPKAADASADGSTVITSARIKAGRTGGTWAAKYRPK
ncbi:MAG: hypothetical protein ACOYI6_04260 [Christensenellales bacterium]